MKNNYIILLSQLLILSIMFVQSVYASESFHTELISNKTIVEKNETLIISINVSSTIAVPGFTAKIEYDKEKLEFIEIKGKNNYSALFDKNLVIDSTDGNNGDFFVAELMFRSKPDFSGGETEIVLKDVHGAFGLIGDESSVTITSNTEKSDCKLTSLTIDGENVLDNFLYTTSKNKINIEAEAENCEISGIGEKSLNSGENIFNIVLKSSNGETKTYTLKTILKDEKKSDSTNNSQSDLKKENTNSPFTNDNIVIYFVTLVISIVALIVCIKFYYKNNKKQNKN